VVGAYYDQNQVEHGLLFRPPNSFISYDYPGAIATEIGGINDRGLLCGSYVDTDGIRHRFLGQLH
jgi:hypothetical protein